MISDVDKSLVALLEHEAEHFRIAQEHAAKIPVKLENSDNQLSGNPVISVFLYDIREDVSLRDVALTKERDDDGRVVARRPGPRYFRLAYLISVIAEEPQTEHWVLGELLSSMLAFQTIPKDYLRGSMVGEQVLLSNALPLGQDRSIGDLWTALGRKLRPCIELTVTAPLRRDIRYDTNKAVETGTLAIREKAAATIPERSATKDFMTVLELAPAKGAGAGGRAEPQDPMTEGRTGRRPRRKGSASQ